jgi:hypothetical protein
MGSQSSLRTALAIAVPTAAASALFYFNQKKVQKEELRSKSTKVGVNAHFFRQIR